MVHFRLTTAPFCLHAGNAGWGDMATDQDGHAQPSKGLVTPRLVNLCVVVVGLTLVLVLRASDPFHEAASPPLQASVLPLKPAVHQRFVTAVGSDRHRCPCIC